MVKQANYPRSNTAATYPAPKTCQARALTIEEKAARYDQIAGIKKAKRLAKRRISMLYRDIERLEAEEAHVLDQDLEFYSSPEVSPCGLCGLPHLGNCNE